MITLNTSKKLHEVAKAKGVELLECNKSFQRLKGTDTFVPVDGYPDGKEVDKHEVIQRYSTDELLEMLPAVQLANWEMFNMKEQKGLDEKTKWRAMAHTVENDDYLKEYADTPSEALALLLIELIEKDIIKKIK